MLASTFRKSLPHWWCVDIHIHYIPHSYAAAGTNRLEISCVVLSLRQCRTIIMAYTAVVTGALGVDEHIYLILVRHLRTTMIPARL